MVSIKKVETIPAGDYLTEPKINPDGKQQLLRNLPGFCRVWASIQLTSDSHINIEVWLPSTSWNGKLLGVGNGGFIGDIYYPQMGMGLTRGYAVAATDTGHTGGDASWAPGHLEKQIDFGHRAVHLMTVNAKNVIKSFYGHLCAQFALGVLTIAEFAELRNRAFAEVGVVPSAIQWHYVGRISSDLFERATNDPEIGAPMGLTERAVM